MAYPVPAGNKGGTYAADGTVGLAAQVSGNASQLYQKTLEVYEQSTDFFQQLEGTGRDALIKVNTDVSKGAGQKVTIRSLAGFYQEPKEGDEEFSSAADFESFVMNDYSLQVDYIRWATRMTERSEEFMGLRGELKAGVPREAGKWLGRIKSERMFMALRERSSSENKLVVGQKTASTTSSTLLSGDTLSYDEIIAATTKLKSLGGEPASISTQGKNKVKGYAVISGTDSLFSLETDPTYQNNLRTGGLRGNGNLLFTGGYSDVRGNIIMDYNAIDHDGNGAIGSALNPKALLGANLTLTVNSSNVCTDTITGGGTNTNTSTLFFKYFPGFNYDHGNGDQAVSSGNGPHYLLIINPNDGSDDANKIAFCKYEGAGKNDGNKIVLTHAANVSGSDDNPLDGVDSDAAPWSGNMTLVLKQGATILPCTSRGVPIAYSLFLSKGAAVRGYGKHRNKRGIQTHEDGFIQDLYIRSVFGQAVREDASGRKPGVIRLTHSVKYPGLALPIVQ